jgi:membrane dipeptidase
MVQKRNEIGILVDAGHCKPQTLIDAVEVSEKPIACSHAGMASRVKNPRTQSDEALKKLGEKGGVFGLVSTPGALNGTDRCSVVDYVDNIEAAVNLIGIDHVAFGSDLILAASLEEIFTALEWGPAAQQAVGVSESLWPWSDGHEGMENNSGYPNLTRGLVARGFNDQEIGKIMGGNFLRLIEDTIG